MEILSRFFCCALVCPPFFAHFALYFVLRMETIALCVCVYLYPMSNFQINKHYKQHWRINGCCSSIFCMIVCVCVLIWFSKLLKITAQGIVFFNPYKLYNVQNIIGKRICVKCEKTRSLPLDSTSSRSGIDADRYAMSFLFKCLISMRLKIPK